VTEYRVGRNGLGGLARIRWERADDTDTNMEYLDMNEVAAVHSEGLGA
jgi:hypothetical protein